MATLSLRRLWVIYKRTVVKSGLSQRERINAARPLQRCAGILKVLAYLMEHGDYDELHATIRRHARQIGKIRST